MIAYVCKLSFVLFYFSIFFFTRNTYVISILRLRVKSEYRFCEAGTVNEYKKSRLACKTNPPPTIAVLPEGA